DIVETHDEVHQGGFSSARGPDDRHSLTGTHGEVHVPDQWHLGGGREVDTTELHGTGGAGQGGGGPLRADVGLRPGRGDRWCSRRSIRSIRRGGTVLGLLCGIEQLENALGGGHTRLQLIHHARHLC